MMRVEVQSVTLERNEESALFRTDGNRLSSLSFTGTNRAGERFGNRFHIQLCPMKKGDFKILVSLLNSLDERGNVGFEMSETDICVSVLPYH